MGFVPPPFPTGSAVDESEIADWVEYSALSQGYAFKRGDLKGPLSTANVKNPDRVEEAVWEELRLREELFGPRWPLTYDADRLSPSAAGDRVGRVYRYLCLLGLGQHDAVDYALFEELAGELIRAVFHDAVLRIGHPASVGMDKSFPVRLSLYIDESDPLVELLNRPLAHDKDLGIDIVAWWPFEDKRGGYLHVLMQCATGRDWSEKLVDIDFGMLTRHVKWSAPPLRVFCVPRVLNLEPARWQRVSDKAGIVLDRPRLMELLRRRHVSSELSDAIDARIDVLGVA